MIVLGADTHKRSHTVAAVAADDRRAARRADRPGRRRGFDALLRWARGLDGERVWALEDCRHVSGSLERFLIARGERVLRIPTQLTADAARARAARQVRSRSTRSASPAPRCAEGLETFPVAQLDGPELDLRLLVDHRERLVRQRVGAQQHAAVASARSLARARAARQLAVLRQLERRGSRGAWRAPSRRCASASPATSCAACASSSQAIKALEPRSPSSSPDRSAAALRARVRAADGGQARRRDRRRRSASPPSQARPRRRRRADPRQLGQHPSANASTGAATARSTPRCTASSSPAPAATPRPAPTSPARRSEGKTTREAIRCLKRYLARRVWRLLRRPTRSRERSHPSIS